MFEAPGAWVRYNAVQFPKVAPKSLEVCVQSSTGGLLEVRLDKINGPIVSSVSVSKGSAWQILSAPMLAATSGKHDLFFFMPKKGEVRIDWAKFK
jgi:hypothetical protein